MFKKLVAYLLLFNFVNTVCFYDMPSSARCEGPAALVLEAATDEIDSLTEFIAEVCFNLEDNFDDGNSDDLPDNLKKTQFKHFIADAGPGISPVPYIPENEFAVYREAIPCPAIEALWLPPECIIA
jgi:hypothetical protein